MRTRNVKPAAIAVAVVLAGLAVGLALWLTSGSTSTPKPLSHAGYVHLFLAAAVGKTSINTVESTWPKPPYQDFHDGAGNHCLEYIDPLKDLYDLCFNKAGLLISRQNP
jgi:hypothetical protein